MFSRLSGEGIKVVSRSAKCLSVVNREYSGTGGSRYSGTGGSRYKAWTPAGSIVAIASSCALGYFAVDFLQPRIAYAEAPLTEKDLTPPERKDLPVFKKEDVKKHGRNSESIWVTYKGGVYDITEFRKIHPGGDKILLAAGGAVDHYWALYAQHKTKEVMEILEEYRIGSLDPRDVEASKSADASDPFSKDPERHPALIVNQQRPFNAETPPELMVDHFRTPNELFFVRHHLPVPEVDPKKHKLVIDGLGVKRPMKLSVDELKKNFRPVSITSAIQCAGNRRSDMSKYKKTQGLQWSGTAISNAEWTGVRLRDLLLLAGVDPDDPKIKHVHLEGADSDPTGQSYGASIPLKKAMSPEVIIAYSMNGKDLPRDHGAPLRCVVPGVVGARQVKWLKAIRTSDVESPSHWQQKDYKVFPPHVGPNDKLDWESLPALQEYPVQSAFCIPAHGTKVKRDAEVMEVAGYAWSGGGRGIVRVLVSADGGKTWQDAELEQAPEQDLDHMWAWTLFRATIKIPDGVNKMELVVKATDRSHNTQPEGASGIWNVRGLIHNAWHRVEVEVID